MSDSTVTNPPTETVVEPAKTQPPKRALTKVLPTDRISFDKQIAILRAFAAVHEANGEKPVSNDEVGKVLTPKMAGSTILQMNAFLADTGLVARNDGGNFTPSAELIAYNKARQWDEKGAGFKLKPLLERMWFSKSILPHVQLAPQQEAQCLAVLAEESNAGREHQERLRLILLFMELAGIVSLVGGMVSPATQEEPKPKIDQKSDPQNDKPSTTHEDGADTQTHTLFLDKSKSRKFVITAPLEVPDAEFTRIKKWLEAVLNVPPTAQ